MSKYQLLEIDFTAIPVTTADILRAYADGSMTLKMAVEILDCDHAEFFELLISYELDRPSTTAHGENLFEDFANSFRK